MRTYTYIFPLVNPVVLVDKARGRPAVIRDVVVVGDE
jgi:hypothetical protein